MPLIEQLQQTQYLVKTSTSGSKKLILILKGIRVQMIMATTLPIANGLCVHGNDVLFQRPKRVNSHP